MWVLGKRLDASKGFVPVGLLLLSSLWGCAQARDNDGDSPADPGDVDSDSDEDDVGTDDDGVGLDGGNPPKGNDTDSGSVTPGSPTCEQSLQRWQAIAQANCAGCHGPTSTGEGGFATVLDPVALIAGGKVVPGNPDQSPLYALVQSGEMPPDTAASRPSQADVEAVRNWISCGAPSGGPPPCEENCTTFIDIDTRLSTMLQDVQTFSAQERTDIRYLDLSNFGNAGHGELQLQVYREGLTYLLNSLSRGPTIATPQAVDSQKLIFRIRLSTYAWTPAIWERVVTGYPYAITYDPESRAFPISEENAQALRDATGTELPYVQADWFFSQVARAPLYYEILGMPDTLAALEAELGVDIQDNIAAGRVARVGFSRSGASPYNRVIERHLIDDQRGALWLTYDFDSGAGTSNVITRPLDFVASSSELFFNLPNGFQAYMIVDAQGDRLDQAPNSSVKDPLSGDLAIENGISCISCHAELGLLSRQDEVRAAAEESIGNLAQLDEILAIYPPQSEIDQLFANGQALHRQVLSTAGMRTFVNGSVHTLNDAYRGLVSFADVAGAVGLSEAQLGALVDATPRVFPPQVQALRTLGTAQAREVFETFFDELVLSLRIGQPRLAN